VDCTLPGENVFKHLMHGCVQIVARHTITILKITSDEWGLVHSLAGKQYAAVGYFRVSGRLQRRTTAVALTDTTEKSHYKLIQLRLLMQSEY
jgi:hypothetical protein